MWEDDRKQWIKLATVALAQARPKQTLHDTSTQSINSSTTIIDLSIDHNTVAKYKNIYRPFTYFISFLILFFRVYYNLTRPCIKTGNSGDCNSIYSWPGCSQLLLTCRHDVVVSYHSRQL